MRLPALLRFRRICGRTLEAPGGMGPARLPMWVRRSPRPLNSALAAALVSGPLNLPDPPHPSGRDPNDLHSRPPFVFQARSFSVSACFRPADLIEWFWNQIHRYIFEHFRGTNAHLVLVVTIVWRSVVFDRQTKFQSEELMAGVYLGIMIAGVNTLIVLGAAFAFAVI
jgi:hypothetical protein